MRRRSIRPAMTASLALAFAALQAAADPIPRRLIVLTFDDSVKSHFTVAGPILKRYGFGATFGGWPEYPRETGFGVPYEPARDHPLLILSIGVPRPSWDLFTFISALGKMQDGFCRSIAVSRRTGRRTPVGRYFA